jgi:hypothetical protein
MSDNTKRAELADREFFDAHPDRNVRRRPIVVREVPRSLAGRNIRIRSPQS